MKKYTIETLKAINESYDHEHRVTQYDVDMANELVEVIEGSRNKDIPQVGDMIDYTNKHGDYYSRAHIESIEDEKLYICENPSIPFTSIHGIKGISTSTSGGAWSYIPMNLKYVGTKKKLFKDWGHCGARGNGAVTFYAEVSVWEYIEGNPEYTTKTHDRFHVSIREKVNLSDYKYLVTKGSSNQTAFHTDEEYEAWLKTYHGVEKDGAWGNSRTVWTYKQDSQCIPLEDYLKIEDAIVDSELCNGTIQECKRIYEGTKVKTYLPFQNDKIEMKGVKEYRNAY